MLRSLVLCLVLAMPLAGETNAQESDAPYIYYYSPYLQGFVIERADGTDSRLMGEGLSGEIQADYIGGPGWSPSGRWFAWTASTVDLTARPTSGQVLSVENGETLNLSAEGNSIYSVLWSPVEDLLFFIEAGGVRPYSGDFGTYTFRIVNYATQEVLVEGQRRSEPGLGLPEHAHWAPDGQSVSYYIRHENESDSLVTIYLDGTVIQRPAISLAYLTGGNAWSTTGWTAYRVPDGNPAEIHLLNVQTNENFTGLLPETGRFARPWVIWNPEGDFGALYLPDHESGDKLFLINTHTQSITFIDTISDAVFHPPLQPSQFPDPFGQYEASWSPDGRFLAFRTHKEFSIFDTITNGISTLDSTSNDLTFRWLIDSRSAFIGLRRNVQEQVFREFNITTGETTPIDQLIFGSSFSPSMQYRFSRLDRNIVNLSSGQSAIFPETTAAPLGAKVELLWNDESTWVFGGDRHGNDWPVRGISIMRADGTYWRELSHCLFQEPCFGFLPPQVPTDQLPQGQPTSVLPQPDMQFDIGQEKPILLFWRPDNAAVALWPVEVNNEIGVGIWTLDGALVDFSPRSVDLREPLPVFEWHFAENNYWLEEISSSDHKCDEQRSVISPSGDITAYLSRYGNVVLVQADDEYPYLLDDSSRVRTRAILAFSNDENLIAAGDCRGGQLLRIWNANNGNFLREVNFYPGAVAFSPNNQWLAASGETTVAFWLVETLLSSASTRLAP